MYDTAYSSSPYSLRSHVSELLDIPLDRLRMAKHKLESFEWIRIQDSYKVYYRIQNLFKNGSEYDAASLHSEAKLE